MTRFFLTGCALVALAACQPAIPDSAAGVGFDNIHNSPEARAKRDAQLSGTALPNPQAVSGETIPAAPTVAAAPLATTATASAPPAPAPAPVALAPAATATTSEAAEIARETQSALNAASVNSGQQPLDASPSNPAPEVFSNPGISDNSFGTVGDQRSIEADAAQRERNKAQYQVVTPGAVPTRSGSTGPNIVAYALSTTNPVGVKQHSRLKLKTAAQYEAACSAYPSSDLAQIAFLEKGGPKRDRLGLDPDGDGFACDWDPTPFRSVSGN
ncbi:hypothetical protein [Shimia haliotis]|uniref:Excalibur calcium-binding domain-containing protein n=1 Tax=Shimia haliotis TaxID=1280847 RepID=A0A1I4CPV1_9RHOB|nr:hypothetical protein [Shimia haliotis]SFK82299.1 hypothetical protein SAMN04488036_102370 [Shimia haliotis]